VTRAETPSTLGYRMPAEWEPHAATWLAWPHERRDWPGKFATIPWVYAEVVRHLVAGERVRILVADTTMERSARALLNRAATDLARVDFHRIATDRSWTRDFCPLFVRRDADGDVAATNWKFNAWAKYSNWRRDDAAAGKVARALRRREWKTNAVLEGGSIDVNGRGTLLTTEECLLDVVQARNPGLERAGVERLLHDYLGVRKTIWLGKGIAGDDTHGHVDDLARFVDPRTVVLVAEEDPSDVNYAPLRDNLRRLEQATDQDGEPLRVVTLPMPSPLFFAGQRLPASYANFYVGNRVVLVPTFNDARDREALATLAELFPGRQVVGIHAVDLVWGFGTLHCMTQQEPAGQDGLPG
jgi:agmatine deiminase